MYIFIIVRTPVINRPQEISKINKIIEIIKYYNTT
jgi:hypothetical protein